MAPFLIQYWFFCIFLYKNYYTGFTAYFLKGRVHAVFFYLF